MPPCQEAADGRGTTGGQDRVGERSGASDDWAVKARRFGRAGLFLVLAGAVLFALVPLAEADNRAYAAAPDCPAGTRADTCRAAVTETVTAKGRDSDDRNARSYLRLRAAGAPAADDHRVEFTDPGPVHDAVRRGDRVTVTYWKDQVRAVRFGDRTQQAALSRVHDGRLPGAFAVAALAGGLGALSFWARSRRRPVRAGDRYPWGHTVGFVTGLLVACAGFPVVLLGSDVWAGLRFTAGAVVPALLFSVLVCWWSVRRGRRGPARVVPVPPAGRRVLRAVVHGDVPYSRPGYDCLVIGDGPPTATPDPTGKVALAPLPATLTVRRVRELLVGEPPFVPPSRRETPVVVECADGDRTVLVLAGENDAPRVLGALLAAAAAAGTDTDAGDYLPSD